MKRIRALQPAHKSKKVTVSAATQAFKKLARERTTGGESAGNSPVHSGTAHRRLPRRGFKPFERIEYQVINLYQLQALDGDGPVTPATLKAHGLIGHAGRPVKVLGTGELTRKLDVSAHYFSQSARDKIIAAGGAVHELDDQKGDRVT